MNAEKIRRVFIEQMNNRREHEKQVAECFSQYIHVFFCSILELSDKIVASKKNFLALVKALNKQ